MPSNCHYYHPDNRGHRARHGMAWHACFGKGTTGRVNKCHSCFCIPCVVVSPSPGPVSVVLAESSWNASVEAGWNGAPFIFSNRQQTALAPDPTVLLRIP
ncbi:hypothetical protein CGRA01v4_03129 [Colletotrichum graminicola]|nr:hypothetical protein CGRA01v4_03129 [Colletotrichum graminicola]